MDRGRARLVTLNATPCCIRRGRCNKRGLAWEKLEGEAHNRAEGESDERPERQQRRRVSRSRVIAA